MLLDKLQQVLLQTATQKKTITYCVWGKHGIGKSQVVEQVAKSLNYGFRNVRCSQIDPVELIGYPNKKQEEITYPDGSKELIEYLDYSPPKWFVEALRGNYVIFLDELNRAKKDVQQAVFELVNERTLNGRKLPDSVLIVAACNPSLDKYDTIEFDDALVDRFCHVLATSNFEVWTDWARTKNALTGRQRISNDIVSFLSEDSSRQSFDFMQAEDRQFPVECRPTPRAWSRANEIYTLNLPTDMKKELMSGVVGLELTMNFFNSLSSSRKPISLESLFEMNENDENDPVIKKIKSYSRVDIIDVNTEKLDLEEDVNVEIALLDYTCKDFLIEENTELVKRNFSKVFKFLSLVPAALAQKTLNALVKTNRFKKEIDSEIYKTVDGRVLTMQEKKDLKKEDHSILKWQVLVSNLTELHEARRNSSNRILNKKEE